MTTFFSLLERRVDHCGSLLCVGLDPHISDLPQPSAEAARTFCLNLVKHTAPYAAAFKPNIAFFEVFGADGWTALKDVIDAIHEEAARLGVHIPVILDAKRGDIASTAEAYAQAAFQTLGADCITLNPYLGKDSIDPFIGDPQKGVFLLCKTSNKGAGDLQDLMISPPLAEGEVGVRVVPLYIHVAQLAQTWNTRDNIGLVVGATQPESMARIRAAAPGLWFLAPGVGAQGGDLESALRAGLRPDGKGLLLPISRGISRSADPARAAAEFRDDILAVKRTLRR